MARRINTKFVVRLLAGVAAAALLAVVATTLLIRDNPDKYVHAGQDYMHDHNWEEAAKSFTKAIQLGRRDPELQMMLAAALREQENTALDALSREIQAMRQALDINPNYKPALDGLIRAYQLILVRITPTPQNVAGLNQYFRQLGECVGKLRQMDPTNLAVVDVQNKAILQQWMMKLEVGKDELTAAMNQLRARLKVDAGDAEIPALLAQVYLQQADDIRRALRGRPQTPEMTQLFQNAVSAFETAIATETAQNARYPELHARYSRLLEVLMLADQSDAKNVEQYRDRCSQEMKRAQMEVKENEPLYISIGLEAAALMQRQGKIRDAERILRELPDTDDVKMQLASLLENDPATLQQSVNLLEDLLNHRGGEGGEVTPLNFHPLLVLTRVRLKQFETTTDQAEKQRLLKAVLWALERMKVKYADDMDVVYLQGEADMLQGNPVAAIQRLRRATELNPDFQRNWNVMRLLALAYDAGNQTKDAVEILKRTLDSNPNNLDALRTMVRVMVHHDPLQVQDYLAALEKLAPDDPVALDSQLVLLSKQANADPGQVRKYFDRLPEATQQQVYAKLQKANALRLWDDAIRLISPMVKDQPNNTAAALDLARYYLLTNKRDHAQQVIQDALKANPKDDELLLFDAKTFQNASPDTIVAIEKDLINRMTDPLDRELAYCDLYRKLADQVQYEVHLHAAQKMAPDSPIVLANLFDNALANNRLDEAEQYGKRITELNADNAHGLLYAIRLARARQDYDRALDLSRDLVQDKPEFAQAWLTFGQVLQTRGEYQQAINQYNTALDRQADNTTAMEGLIQCYDALRRPDEALRLIRQLMKTHPDQNEFHLQYVEHLLQFGNPVDAIAALQEQIKRTPQPQLYGQLGSTYVRVARMMKQLKREDDCKLYLQSAFDVLNQSLKTWPDEAIFYGTLADADVTAGKPQDAEAILKQWAEQPNWKNRPEPYRALANLYQLANQPGMAEEQMRTAVAKSGYQVDLQLQYSALLVEHGKSDEAIELLGAANADKPDVIARRIRLEITTKHYPQAQDEIKKYLAGNPANRGSLLAAWGLLAFDQNQYVEGLQHCNDSLQFDPNNAEALFYRGQIELHLQPPDPQHALDDLRRARTLFGNTAEVHLSLARAYEMLGRGDESIGECEAALRLQPGNKSLRLSLVSTYCASKTPRLADALALLRQVDTVPPFAADPDIFIAEAKVLAQNQKMDEALAASGKACDLSKNAPAAVQVRVPLLAQAGQLQAALDLLTPLAETCKNELWYWRELAQVRKGLQDLSGALDDFQHALALANKANDTTQARQVIQTLAATLGNQQAIATAKPLADQQAWAALALMNLYFQEKQIDPAIAVARQTLKLLDQLAPDDQAAALKMAALLFSTADPKPLADEAVAAYKKLLVLRPDDYEAMNNLAEVLADDYSPTRAVEGLPYIKQAIAMVDNSRGGAGPEMLDTQGWLTLLSGDVDDGIADLQNVVHRKAFPEAYYHLGEGYLLQSYPEDAARQAAKGLELMKKPQFGDDPKMAKKLNDLLLLAKQKMKAKATTAPAP